MATVAKEISLPHGTIPTQMFGNINLQNAIMYVNENFAAVKEGVNDAIAATNEVVAEKADSDHDHDEDYAALEHTHTIANVTGLSSALDDKAALNHEHSQYLSSLPSHYHDVQSVQGLGELLQQKAEATHSHTIAQVENLATELGVKASTSYVDQQIQSVSNSIKTVADNEIESYAADKDNVDNAPKNVELAPENETDAQKKARIGTSVYFARKDHKHVFETETSDLTKLKHDGNGTDGTASFGTETKVPRIDHSHPLNFPDDKPTNAISQDGMGEGGAASFGETNYYADLGHSHPLNVALSGLPSDVVKSTGTSANGTSEFYARQDHVHKMPALAESDITNLESDLEEIETTVDSNTSRIEVLEARPQGGVTSVNGKTGEVVLDADDVGALDSEDIGVSVQEYDEGLTTLADNLSDGKVPLSQLTGNIDGHSGTCYVTIANDGTLGHSGNKAYNLLNAAADATKDANKIITDKDVGNGIRYDSSYNLSVKVKENGGITVDENGVALGGLSGTGFVKSENGTLSVPSDQPITKPSGSGALYSDGTTISVKSIGSGASYDIASGGHTHAYGDGTITGLGTAAASNATDFAPSSTVSFPGFGTVAGKASEGNHTHTHSAITDLGDAATKNVGVNSGVQEYSAPLTTLAGNLNIDGTIPSANVKDANCTSNGQCFAFFNASKQLAHLGNTGITVSRANQINACFTHTEATAGVSTDAKLNVKAAGESTAPTTQKVIGFKKNESTASLLDAATVDTTAASVTTGTLMTWDGTNGKFVTDGNSYSKFSSTPVGSKLVQTSGTDGTVIELNVGTGIEIDPTNGLELSDVMTSAQASNVSAGKKIVTASSVLKLIDVDELTTPGGSGVDGYKIKYRQPIVDQYGRITGLSDFITLCEVFKYQ